MPLSPRHLGSLCLNCVWGCVGCTLCLLWACALRSRWPGRQKRAVRVARFPFRAASLPTRRPRPLVLLKAAPTRSPLLPQGPGPRWRFHSSSTCPGPQSLGPVGAGWGAGGGRVGCAHCFLRGKPPGPCSVPGLSSRAILPPLSCVRLLVPALCSPQPQFSRAGRLGRLALPLAARRNPCKARSRPVWRSLLRTC